MFTQRRESTPVHRVIQTLPVTAFESGYTPV